MKHVKKDTRKMKTVKMTKNKNVTKHKDIGNNSNNNGNNNGMKHDEVSGTSIEELELRSWKHKLIGAWTFTIPIAFIMFSGKLFGFSLVPEWMMIPLLLILYSGLIL
jgi:hypothetical protein